MVKIILTIILCLFCSLAYAVDLTVKECTLTETKLRTNYVDYTRDANTLAVWRFNDDLHLTSLDTSGNNKHGIATNGPTYVEGKIGKAWDFDGATDYLSNPVDTIGAEGTLTIVAWINIDVLSTGDSPFFRSVIVHNESGTGDTGGLVFAIDPSGNQLMRIRNDANGNETETSTNTIATNTWTHVAVTYTDAGNSVAFYKNGVADGASANSITLGDTAKVIAIGFDSGGFSPFNGTIDEVGVFDRVLSAAEIKDIYMHGLK